MKKIYLAFFFLLIYFSSNSQNISKSDKFKISFESTEILENYETESDFVLGFDNNNYAVDIEIISTKNIIIKNTNDLKRITRELASSFSLTAIKNGSKLPQIEMSYYVKANGIESDTKYPVFVLFIINDSLRIAYEITIDCYNHNEEEGLKIARSFKLLK